MTSANRAPGAVFISYASQDEGLARRIRDGLKASGIEVWFDQSELRGGVEWDREIRAQIRACALFVPILSAAALARQEGYFRLEWNLAEQRAQMMGRNRPFIFPVSVEGSASSDADVPDVFLRVQWTRLPADGSTAELVQRIRHLLQSDATSLPGQAADMAPTPFVGLRERVSHRTSRLIALASVSVVLITAALFYWFEERPGIATSAASLAHASPVATPTSQKSIAVLPFVDMSEKKDQEYFADGLSEELIEHLVHAPDLKVIARTSSFQFKGKSEDIRLIAAQLGVANLLEGSVRFAGRAVRVTVQLVQASDGTHLWSQTYDREVADIFKVQDEISDAVAAALSATLKAQAHPGAATKSPEAYNLLLKGNFFYDRNHKDDEALAIEQYREALKLDPGYALAWTNLGRAYLWQGFSSDLERHEQQARIEDAFRNALRIDPGLPNAHRWLGRFYMTYNYDWGAARQEYERTMALDSSGAQGDAARGDLVTMNECLSGHLEESVQSGYRDLERDPLGKDTLYLMSRLLVWARRYTEALTLQHRMLELDPDAIRIRANAAKTLVMLGNHAEGVLEAAKERDPVSRLGAQAIAYWADGQTAAARAAIKDMQSEFPRAGAYGIAAAYAYFGEADSAMTWLNHAYEERNFALILINVDPFLDRIRGDTRFRALLSKLGMVAHQ